MQHSETIGKISAALAKAQGAMATAAKDAKGNYGKYADLASIWESVREPLTKNEIAVIQAPGATADKAIEMTTILSHASGEWFKETLTIPMQRVDAQGYGSAVTYARRYALAAMVGIAPAEDDGEAAKAIGGEASAPRSAPKAVPRQEAPKIEEPPEGWSKWALDLQAKIAKASDAGTVEALRKDADARIRALRTIDQTIYNSIGKSFVDKRAALQPEPEKEAA